MRQNQIIGELLINGSVQYIGFSQTWGSRFPYIVNLRAHVEATGWGSSCNGNTGSGNPGYRTVTGSWGGIVANSNVNWSGNWDISANASTDYSTQSTASPRVA